MTRQQQQTDAARLQPHLPMIFQLYRNYTLDTSKEYLGARFDFNTEKTKRPWTYQLEKSGARKYNQKAEFESKHQEDQLMDLANQPEHPSTPLPAALEVEWPWLWNTQMHNDKLKADFCAATGDLGTAFDTYNKLLPVHLDQNHAGQRHIIVNLARFANTPERARKARDLLQSYRGGLDDSDSDVVFLLPMFDAFLAEMSGDNVDNVTRGHVRQVVQELMQNETFAVDLPHRHSTFDLVSCFLLEQGLTHLRLQRTKKDDYFPDDMLYGYTFRQPLFRHANHRMPPSLLISCASWCIAKLNLNPAIQLDDLVLGNELHQRWWDNNRIFCTLWDSMLQDTSAGCAPDWSTMSESAFGISPTELLVTLVWTAELESPVDPDQTMAQNSAAGFEALLKHEGRMWNQFISEFFSMNLTVTHLINQHEVDFRAMLNAQVQHWLSQRLSQRLSTGAVDSSMDISPDLLLSDHVNGDMDVFGNWDPNCQA